VHDRLKDQFVLLSADGPHRNVLKFKPPLCFSVDDVDECVSKLDAILAEVECDDPPPLGTGHPTDGSKPLAVVGAPLVGHVVNGVRAC
jgi:hypothetical protein